MSVQYKLEYDDDGARQVGREIVPAVQPRVAPVRRKRKFRLPAAANTALTIIICGSAFFAAVAFAPEGWRPQDFTGQYVGDVAGEVKANEAAIDSELQAYVNGVRAAYEQRSAQYGRIAEGYLEAYKASVALNQQQMDAANRLRGSFVDRQMGQTVQSNGTNLSIANLTEMFGSLQNFVEPGSGDAALSEAQRQREIAAGRLQDTATTSANVDLSGYVNQLPSADALRRQLDSIPPLDLPPPPRFERGGN